MIWDILWIAVILAILVTFGSFILSLIMMAIGGIFSGIVALVSWIVSLFNKD